MTKTIFDWEEEEEWKLVNNIAHIPGQLSFNFPKERFLNKKEKIISLFDQIINFNFNKEDREDLLALAEVMDLEKE